MKQVNVITNSSDIFNIYVYVPAGSIYETDGIRGISHLLEHMLLKHTKNFTNKSLFKEITKIGGISNAGTSKDVTYYYIKTHIDNYKMALKIMNDIINFPIFTEQELEKEKKIVLEEFAQRYDDLEDKVDNTSTLTVLKKENNYSYLIRGERKDLLNISLSDLKKYYNLTYSKYLVIINTDKKYKKIVLRDTYKYFGNKELNLSKNLIAPKFVNSILDEGLVSVVNYPNITQFITILAFPTYSIQMIKKIAILNFIKFALTSSGFNSILFSEIREKRGLVYGISSYHEDNRYLGLLKFKFSSTNKNTVYIISIILSYLKNMIINGLSNDKLKYFKLSFINKTKYIFSEDEVKETWYSNSLFYDVNITINEYLNIIKKITNEDVKMVSKEIFDFKKMGVSSYGNYTNTNIDNEIIDIKNTYNKI
jgi:predicted Zn-dependent peptidase